MQGLGDHILNRFCNAIEWMHTKWEESYETVRIPNKIDKYSELVCKNLRNGDLYPADSPLGLMAKSIFILAVAEPFFLVKTSLLTLHTASSVVQRLWQSGRFFSLKKDREDFQFLPFVWNECKSFKAEKDKFRALCLNGLILYCISSDYSSLLYVSLSGMIFLNPRFFRSCLCTIDRWSSTGSNPLSSKDIQKLTVKEGLFAFFEGKIPITSFLGLDRIGNINRAPYNNS